MVFINGLAFRCRSFVPMSLFSSGLLQEWLALIYEKCKRLSSADIFSMLCCHFLESDRVTGLGHVFASR